MDDPARAALEARWLSLLAGLGCEPAAARPVFAELVVRYGSPKRHYHTLDHIAAVLDTALALLPDAAQTPALALSVWFHDAVYDTRAADNEEQSAALAETLLRPLHVAEGVLREATRLILLTKTHAPEEGDRSGMALIDADLAILGAAEDAYDRYAQAIRREYAWVPDAEYRAGRRRMLEGFLARPRIYRTEAMQARAEERARANLRRERDALR